MSGTSADRLTNQTGGLEGDTLGATGGAETHTLKTAQMPSHTHSISGTQRRDEGGSPGGFFTRGSLRGTTIDISGFLSLTNSSTGGDQSHNNVQPIIVLNYIIKT